MDGLHILAELHDCDCARTLLHDVALLRTTTLNACRSAGLTVVAEAFHAFKTPGGEPAGATGALVLAESHLALHTWPEVGQGSITLDLYVCNYSRDNSVAATTAFDLLCSAFAPRRVVRRDVRRPFAQSPEASECNNSCPDTGV